MSSPLIVSICGEQSLVAVVVLSNQTVTIQTNFFLLQMILTGCQKDTNPTHLPFGLSAFLSSEYGQVLVSY